MVTPSTLWDQVLSDLRAKMDETSFNTWIEPVHLSQYDRGTVTLAVPSLFVRNWLANTYEELIAECLSEVVGHEVMIEYSVQEDHDEAHTPLVEPTGDLELSPAEQRAMHNLRRAQSARTATFDLSNTYPLNPSYTFEHFVVGESNRFAHAAAQAVADPQTRVYNPLFIYGGVGLGKTHLMQAIGHQMMQFGDHFNVLYVSSEAFMNTFIESVAQKNMANFRNYFRNVDLLMVDDVQFFAGAEQTQTEFFHTFNTLYESGKKIIITSDHPPKELTSLEERLRSRFEWGLIVDVQAPDLETRVAILRQKARMMGLELPNEVTIFIAERIRSNLRKLEGALTRLAAHASLNSEKITVESARRHLGPFLVGEEPLRLSIEKIQMTICNSFGITLHELTGPNRSRKFSVPRQLAAYLCRELTNASFPEIANRFGGRDHSSIIHAHRKIQKDMVRDLRLQNQVKYLIKQIKDEASGH